MTFAQWWRKRIKRRDLALVSPEGLAIYREMCAEAWNAAQLVSASRDRLVIASGGQQHD